MAQKLAFTMLLVAVCPQLLLAQAPVFTQTVATGTTVVSITDLEHRVPVNPMIYGQMLEDCNDNVIYGGVVNTADDRYNITAKQFRMKSASLSLNPCSVAIVSLSPSLP